MKFLKGERTVPKFDGWNRCKIVGDIMGPNELPPKFNLTPMEIANLEIIADDKRHADTRGTPTMIADIGDGMLRLWPVPDRDYEVVG